MMKHLFYAFSLRKMRFTWLIVIVMVGLGISLSTTRPAYAAAFEVNSLADTVDVSIGNGVCADSVGNCTLRAAIQETNALAGADTITFNSSINGSTPIALSITGSGEDAAVSGDLDVTTTSGGLTITGNGTTNTIIDATAMSDRVFQLFSGITVSFNNLTIKGGNRTGADPMGSGAGILSSATLTLNNVQVTGNTAGDRGGGVYSGFSASGSTTFNNVYVHGNFAGGRGGGLYFESGTSTVNNSTISNNTVTAPGTSGGGIFVGDTNVTLSINNSTLSGNTAQDSGGGLALYQNGSSVSATLNHVTVAFNTANAALGGGGGGLARIVGGALSLGNTIVSNNSSSNGPDCRGTLTSQGYNMTGTDCGISQTGDIVDDPLLELLADNGGPTLTHALATNSPAIDLIPNATNGCGSSYTTDQRGLIRPNDGDGNSTGECEIGAYEVGEKKCSVSSGNNYTFTSQSGVLIHVNSTGTNLSCLFVDEKPTNHPNATGVSAGIQTGKYWTIEGFQLDGTPATENFSINLTLPHSISPDTNAYVCKFPGGLGGAGWDCARTSSLTGTVTRDNISSLSDWAVGNNVGPTSLTLQTLTARSANLPILITAFTFAGIIILLFAWRKKTAPERQ